MSDVVFAYKVVQVTCESPVFDFIGVLVLPELDHKTRKRSDLELMLLFLRFFFACFQCSPNLSIMIVNQKNSTNLPH